MAVERIIGVDFGTSTSVIRVKRYENGNPIGEKLETKEVTFSGSGAMVPTLIMKKDDDASISYFGYEAQQKKKKFTNFHGFKMDLESRDPAKRAQARLLTEEFYAYLAKQYKSQSEGGHLGNSDDKERTIISYPVKWSEETKSFMLETAKKVGFPNVTGMDEAQAAIKAVTIMSSDHLQKHGLLKSGAGTNVLLIDMGAGTTDLVLARYVFGDEPKIEVLNTWPKSGEIQFGGREIDNLLQNFFRGLLDEDDAEMILRRIGSDKFKSWKEETVSPALRSHDSVSDFEVLDSCVEMMGVDLDDYCLDRAAFENCLADYLKQFPELINGCLQNAGMSGSDVDLVIVTGGHSQWYFVNEMLCGKMPQFGSLNLPKIRENPGRIVPITRPQETVALGLAYNGISGKKEEPPVPPPPEVAEPTFAMEITKSFAISSGGISVEGTIALGELKNGDNVYVWDRDGKSVFTGRVKKIYAAGNRNAFLTDDAVAGKNEYTVLRVEGIALGWLPKNAILFKETNEFAHVPLQELVKIIEEWKRKNPPKPPVGDFLLKIDSYQVFTTGQGTVVWGIIEEGSISTGDRIYVCGKTNNRNLSDTVKRIEKGNTIVETAQKGDKVGLLLPFLKKYEVTTGTHLSTKQKIIDGPGPTPPPHPPQPLTPVDPEKVPYTPENEFEIGNAGRKDCSIRKYTGSDSVVKIPATIRGRKVVEIEKEAFGAIIVPKANTTLEAVIIPDTVVKIGNSAFQCCTNLRYIRANNVRDIGASAFLGCQKLDNPILGNNVVNIGANAFNSCVSLKTAAFGKNVERIGMNAFLACRNLQKLDFGMGDCDAGHVTFPPKLKSIGAQAFHTNELLHPTRCIFKEVLMSKHTRVTNLPAIPCFNPRYCAVFYYD